MDVQTITTPVVEETLRIDMLFCFRILISLFICYRVIEIVVCHYQKPTTKDRITKRYVGANVEVVPILTSEEAELMELTLRNTWKNVNISDQTQASEAAGLNRSQKRPKKSVKIDDSRNIYYEPLVFIEDDTVFEYMESGPVKSTVVEEEPVLVQGDEGPEAEELTPMKPKEAEEKPDYDSQKRDYHEAETKITDLEERKATEDEEEASLAFEIKKAMTEVS